MKKSEKAKVNPRGKSPKMSQVTNEKNAITEERNAIIEDLAPDGEFIDDYEDTSELLSISEVAKKFGLEEKAFTDLLVERGILYREGEGMPLLPNPECVEKGYFLMLPLSILEQINEVKFQINQVSVQINAVIKQLIAVSDQIIAVNKQIVNFRAAHVEIVNELVEADCLRGLREDFEMRDFLLLARSAKLTRRDELLSEKRRLLSEERKLLRAAQNR